jgi:hypothetical protein
MRPSRGRTKGSSVGFWRPEEPEEMEHRTPSSSSLKKRVVEVISRLTIPLSFYSSIENSFVGVYSRLPKTKSKISLWGLQLRTQKQPKLGKKKKKKCRARTQKQPKLTNFFFRERPSLPLSQNQNPAEFRKYF